MRTDLADRLVAAGEGVLPLLRPLFDIPIDQQAQSLLDEAARLKCDDSEVRLAGARALGDMGNKIWTLIRDVQKRALTEDQLVQFKNLLREVPRQRQFHVLDDVVRSFESPEAADFLRELAATARKHGDLEGNDLARMAESVLGKWKPFRIE